MKNLGLGIQELSMLRKRDCVYVDKTEIIYELINSQTYCFLSRPRRFGKSLLVNTIKELFLGNKELFENTYIYDKWDFEEKYPVIKISMAGLAYNKLGLENVLDKELDEIAKMNNIIFETAEVYFEKFKELIIKLSKKNPVAILIDEYDKPIIDFVEYTKREIAEKNREILRSFYSVIKDLDAHIKFFFITGISKFSKLSLFSELNNLTDLTFDRECANVTGYTQEDIVQNYSHYLSKIEADFNCDRKVLFEKIKLWYNGYSWDGRNFVYNPYSVLSFLKHSVFQNYWFQSGTASFLIKLIKEKEISLNKFDAPFKVDSNDFNFYSIEDLDVTAILFQGGYLTIKERIMDEDYNLYYMLAYPNKEVRDSFHKNLVRAFIGVSNQELLEKVKVLKNMLEANKIDDFIEILKTIYADIPSHIFIADKESYYHSIIYLILKLMQPELIEAEKHTNRGRIDALVLTEKNIYIMEFKMSNAKSALSQIKEKEYFEPYLADEREIICLGVSFSQDKKNICEYQAMKLEELIRGENP